MRDLDNIFLEERINKLEKNGGGGSAIHEYSTTEKKVGKWVDGRDVYEKTFIITENISSKKYDLDVNIDEIINFEGSAYTISQIIPLNFIYDSNDYLGVFYNKPTNQLFWNYASETVSKLTVTLTYIK